VTRRSVSSSVSRVWKYSKTKTPTPYKRLKTANGPEAFSNSNPSI